VRLAGGDRELGRRLAKAANLVRAMNEPRALDIRTVTVRLAPDVLARSEPVFVELLATGRTVALRSGPVVMGVAAPAGSGWVGTADLGWLVNVAPGDALTVRVLDAAGNELLAIDYGSLVGGGGPGALTRPRGPGAGTVTFRIDPSWWRNLELPTLQ
jgi:hypothetical protein